MSLAKKKERDEGMDYKKILIDTMMSSKYRGKTFDELKSMFDLSHAQEFTSFMKAFNEGIDDLTFIELKEKFYLASKKGYFKGTFRRRICSQEKGISTFCRMLCHRKKR